MIVRGLLAMAEVEMERKRRFGKEERRAAYKFRDQMVDSIYEVGLPYFSVAA